MNYFFRLNIMAGTCRESAFFNFASREPLSVIVKFEIKVTVGLYTIMVYGK